jgi:hypothetical protein
MSGDFCFDNITFSMIGETAYARLTKKHKVATQELKFRSYTQAVSSARYCCIANTLN